jgi:hypothetical protein
VIRSRQSWLFHMLSRPAQIRDHRSPHGRGSTAGGRFHRDEVGGERASVIDVARMGEAEGGTTGLAGRSERQALVQVILCGP